jgi:TrkA domain protein
MNIRETSLPGLGHMFEVDTISGDRLVIVVHADGTRDLYQYRPGNDERPASVVRLTDAEARQIAGIVGDPTYASQLLASHSQ